MVESAATTPKGAFRADVWLGYTNVFEQDSADTHVLYLDMERLVTAVTVRRGLTDRLEVGGRATLQSAWGGILDGFMLSFHRMLGLGTRNRASFPNGAYGQVLEDGHGHTLVEIPRRSLSLDDVRAFAKWRIVGGPDARGTLAARALVRLPVAQPSVGKERVDVGVAFLGTRSWRGVHLHGMAGGSTVRRSAEMTEILRDRQWFVMAGVERPFGERLSGVVQLTGSTPLLLDFNDHDVDGAPTNLIFGVVGVTRSGWRWEVGMQEDWPPRGPSLDFTLQLGVSRTW
jgi:hypothetical protein